ncbi:SLBB domain-containing protein [Thioalkalivibrio sp. XN279]|uniref:SLBB domain-containing protein n=1 Tax=Thioalkalivibrio sp. XN279 TaxID=2714953 RepID=UPI00140BACD6|nr:SLBB domain-containing protein [Thioalkalivibrio sp. XN279]NHA15460.1 sugar transporter [Thioalkalivibrio sp. XN279]
MTRFLGRLLAGMMLAGMLLAAGVQAQTPTPQQLEMFRQLPPEQQRQLMEQYQQRSGNTIQDQRLQQPSQGDPRGDAQGMNGRNGLNGATDEGPAVREQVLDEATGLPLFGYDLFAGVPSTFAPVTDIPVPTDFEVGVGDTVQVQLFGKTPGNFSLVVNRDGAINFPELGPIQVAGLGFDQMRQLLQDRVSQQMIGVSASVSMGELRSIRVFVLGEATRPGSYMVSSLSTITNALFSSGGVKPIGSLRNIRHKRNGQVVGTLDLYDLLLRGDTRADARLQPGDVIFIPPVGTRVGIQGEVNRPAIYELQSATTAEELVRLAGGLTATAHPQGATLSRVNDSQDRVILDLDLVTATGRAAGVKAGDLVDVPAVIDRMDNRIELAGHVFRPRAVQYRPGMRISDLLPSLEYLKPLADANYLLIRRELRPSRRIVALSADLEQALDAPGSAADVELRPGDRVNVFTREALPEELMPPELTPLQQAGQQRMPNGQPDNGAAAGTELSEEELERRLAADRRAVVDALLEELELQASLEAPAQLVRVDGRVRDPGTYPLEPGMTVSDLLRAGGSLSESAYIASAEVTRYQVMGGEYREAELVEVDLAGIAAGDPHADFMLQPYDFLHVKEVTNWREQESVTLLGEVRFPGTYPIRKGETLLSVLQRAGGLTDRAFPEGAVFTREQLREREAEQLRQLSRRMEADLSALALEGAQAGQAAGDAQAMETIATGRSLLGDLQSATPVGRLAMDLNRVLQAELGSAGDVILEDGDVLMVPGPMQSVTVLGEVQSPTSILFAKGLSRDDYINLSGGMTRRADTDRIYVVRANGQVHANGSRRWFSEADMTVQPGDTIVVPMDIERMRPLPLWSAVTSIIFNLAVAVAAVNSF